MVVQIGSIKYIPGMYEKKRPTGSQLADKYFRDLDQKLIEKKKKEKSVLVPWKLQIFSQKRSTIM